MHEDLIWVSRNQDLQHNLNPLLWKFHKLPSMEHTVQPYLYHTSWYPGRWLCHFIRGITPVFTQKQENREKLMFILFLVGWVLSWSVLLELQWYQQCLYNLPPAEDPPDEKVRNEFNLNVSILQISFQIKSMHSSVALWLIFREMQHPTYRPIRRLINVYICKYGCRCNFMASMLTEEEYHKPRLHY